jgi:eukaryotic-like serine/threonine-protein kinase
MALSVGAKLGPYEVLGVAGTGGMGEVYRARDTRLDRIVAIKILPALLAASPEARQRLVREAKSISSLSHPHICQLYDVGHQDGMDYLVLEYLEGETLADRLERGRMPVEQVLKVGAEIADALEKAHAKGLIHRDLKPGNVMLTKSGAKLLDFGLAKHHASGIDTVLTAITQSKPLTAEGMIVGTYHYMSPEQVEGHQADARSDIFALGAVIYEMATGKRAFDGRTQATVIAAVLERDPEPISTLQPMAPAVLDQVVKTCLHKDPDERFQTAHDLKLQLRWIASGLIASTATGAAVQGPRAGLFKRERIAWAVALLLLVVAVATAWWMAAGRHAGTERVEPLRFEISPPAGTTLSTGEAAAVEVSPDGRRVVFSAESGGKPRLWVRPLDSLDARELPGTEGALYPFWSADSRSVGFFVGNKLRRVPVAAGDPETVATVQQPMGGSWSSLGVILVGSRNDGIFRVNDTGGTPEKVTSLDSSRGETTHRWPSMIDGNSFLFECGAASMSEQNLCVAALSAPQSRRLLTASSNAQYAAGYLFYFHEGALHAHPFDPKKLALTGPPLHVVERVSYDPDSSRALFSVSERLIAYLPGSAAKDAEQAEPAKKSAAVETPKPITIVTEWKAVLANMKPDEE